MNMSSLTDCIAYTFSFSVAKCFALAIGFATFAASVLGGIDAGMAQVVSLVPGSVGTAVDNTGGPSVTLSYNGTATGAGTVLVVDATTKNINTAPPSTLAWGSQTLTLAGWIPSQNTTYRESAIYYLFNPAVGTNNIVLNQAGTTTDILDAFELTGTDGSAPTTAGFDNVNGTSSSVTFNSVVGGSYAAGVFSQNNGNLATMTYSVSPTGTSSASTLYNINPDNSTQSAGGGISNLSSGTDIITATSSDASQKSVLEVAIFKPLLIIGTAWTGTAGDTLWTTGTNWAGNSVPGSDTSVTFGNTGATGTVDLGSTGQTVNGLYFLLTVPTTISSSMAQTLTLDNGASAATPAVPVSSSGTNAVTTAVALNSNAAITVSSGTLTMTGPISNGTNGNAMTLSGSGALILSGNNGYTGGTVDTGVLRVTNTSGSATGSGAVAVNSGGVLGGNGTIIGNVTLSATGAGHLAPQITSGTAYTNLNINGNLTLNNSSVLDYNFGTPGTTGSPGTSDQTLVSGTLSLNGTTTVNIGNQTGFAAGIYKLFGYGSSAGFGAASFAVGTHTGAAANFSYSFSNNTGSDEIDLTALTPGAIKTWTGAVSNGSGGANWDTTTHNWGATNTYFDGNPAPFQGADSVVFPTGATTGNVNVTGNFSPTAVSVTATDQNFVFSGTGSIGGTGLFTVNTAGRSVTLATANTYSGGTQFTAGTLNINNASAIGVGPLTMNSGVTLDNTSGSAITLTTNNPISLGSSFTFTGTNSLNLGTGAVTMTGSPTITVNANRLTIGGSISGAGITKAGPGALALGGGSTFTGGITFNAGELDINGNMALGSGGTLNFNAVGLHIDNTSGGPVTLSTNSPETWQNGGFTFNGSNNLNLGNGAITQNGTVTIGVLGSTLTQTGPYTSNNNPLVVYGSGTLNIQSSIPVLGGGNFLGTLNVGFDTFINNTIGNNQTIYITNGGNVSFSGPAEFIATTSNPINIYDNGTLTLDNTTTNQNYRLSAGTNATPQNVSLNGGQLIINGNNGASVNTLESATTLTIGQSGGSYGAQSGGDALNLVSPTNNVTFTANALTINNGEILFKGNGLGTSSTSAPGTSNVFFTTTKPTLYGNLTTTTTPTSDAGGTNTALPIMARGFGDTVTGGVDNYSLVTYDAATGIRPLSSTEYSANTLVSGTSNGTANNPGSTNNFIESNTNVALTTNTNTAVNSITLENGATISGPGTLQSWSNIYAANGGNNTFSQGAFSGGSSNTNTYFYVMALRRS